MAPQSTVYKDKEILSQNIPTLNLIREPLRELMEGADERKILTNQGQADRTAVHLLKKLFSLASRKGNPGLFPNFRALLKLSDTKTLNEASLAIFYEQYSDELGKLELLGVSLGNTKFVLSLPINIDEPLGIIYLERNHWDLVETGRNGLLDGKTIKENIKPRGEIYSHLLVNKNVEAESEFARSTLVV
ncbi:MAG: hypothetical protein UT34_C0001G0035 [candidate division WS6 bacterium GW2011_GWF2_39_15]|uniref:Uncharacterized protein n=1 Tax=candidate division WS6 bacterium GW2011_GWF2_39_15 TaxID=1619100 RepID=A0A0G0Q6E7_9BACT|nr:MAG: hypothetical protein UT34_C0001G0035 [candidate division WS6 bacterium GW2011_GWF2_39_15]